MDVVDTSNFHVNHEGAPGEPPVDQEEYDDGMYTFFHTLTEQRTEMNRQAEIVLADTQAHNDGQGGSI